MFCDTHCHLFREYYDDLESIIDLCHNNRVDRMIIAGCDDISNKEVMELIKKPGIYGALGIHPENVNDYKDSNLEYIKENINSKKIVAIGEIGLDYHYGKEDKFKQIELFESQLKLAEKLNIPVVIHSRDATEDTINSLKKYKVRGVIHSFSGSLETAKIYIKMGFSLGVNGVITFKNCNLKDVIKEIPLEYIVLETDSPYLTPVPFRGKRNDPSKILNIAEFVSNLKEIDMDELAKITNKNVKRIFDI
jgi:TatD DNase family protein